MTTSEHEGKSSMTSPSDPMQTIKTALVNSQLAFDMLVRDMRRVINGKIEWEEDIAKSIQSNCRQDSKVCKDALAALQALTAASVPKCGTETGYDDILESLRKVDQSPALTVWKDGSYKLWGATDAKYAEGDIDPDWLCTIPLPKAYDTKEMADFIKFFREPAASVPERAGVDWKCVAALSGIGGNDPQECDWPVCGCDPYADKVIAALEECNLLAQPVPAQAEKDADSFTEKRVETLLEEARQTVKPAVMREREAEKIGKELFGFRMSTDNADRAEKDGGNWLLPSRFKAALDAFIQKAVFSHFVTIERLTQPQYYAAKEALEFMIKIEKLQINDPIPPILSQPPDALKAADDVFYDPVNNRKLGRDEIAVLCVKKYRTATGGTRQT